MKIILLDVCLPDYFQGYSGQTFAVPVDGTTTYQELKSSIRYDYMNTFGEKLEGFEKALDDLFWSIETMSSVAFPDLDVPNEDEADMGESVNAYFGVVMDDD